MKIFDSLTEQELVALTDEQIQRYIDYACAENGVPLLPSMVQPPPVVNFEADVKIYTVGHHLHFATMEEATRVADAIQANNPIELDYLSTPSGAPSHAVSRRRSTSESVTVQDAFSAERAAALKDDMAGAQKAEAVYQAAKKEYDRAVNERESYADDIRGKVADAWETHNRRESRRRDFERYLQLADGNREIAARFLANAHRDAQDLLPELFVFAAGETLPTKDTGAAIVAAPDNDIPF